ncbi:hypothetical protein ASPZODRAFT_149341 [Penicilliopsis zonata CBS 506.65]|uniref:TOG domain-containing protein n=1 Tax=Penicilliopsis zonata CBS 506.65 TaxID=1073090 RepID=A0A1L9SRP1_9EURO|nr:hypothetical protein ASPZODRAFT_149341 [Penicilliopsis zonata CBS 506.65]OJJ49885.1 hypothetical protein ASPZODRAFT_149341 [Penicilliopsis zonata CBS 506.65]
MDTDRSDVRLTRALLAVVLTFLFSLNPLKVIFYLAIFCLLYVLLLLNPSEIGLLIANMEQKAAEVLAVLKNHNLAIDTKVAHVTSIKSDIKQKNVPEGAVAPIFEGLRLAMASQHSSLLGAGFSTLGHLLKRLFIQDQHHIVAHQCRILFPLLLERLGDHKDRVRQHAAQAFTDLWSATSAEVEHHVLEVALVGKNPRAKEMSMIWLCNMTKNHGLLFRSHVPSLVVCLEDADSGVRETAKNTVIDLFQNAPARAKSDLKKQLATHNVRKSIANAILTNIGLGSADHDNAPPTRPVSRAEGLHRPASRADGLHQRPISRAEGLHRPASRAEALHQRPVSRAEALHQRPVSVMSSHSLHPDDLSNEELDIPKSRPIALKPERPRSTVVPHSDSIDSLASSAAGHAIQDSDNIEPLNIASTRDIDDLVREMMPYFEGRESEDNWLYRERHALTLRRLTRGNAPHHFSTQYIAAIKTLLDGIFKVVNSLRTTLSTTGCLLIQDIAVTCGPKLDPMVEIIVQNLIKLCAGMKKISAQNGNDSFVAIIENVTYNSRILQHVSSAAQDKNVQLRLHATGWIKTLINRQARHQISIDHAGGLDVVEKCIRKSLADANPGVREAMRSTFWAFYKVWPDRANEILSSLDTKSRSLLEKDASNPNANASSSLKGSTASRSAPSKNTSAIASRSALKDAIAARKKAHLKPADNLPPRPESAQSTFSEVKTSDPAPKSSTVRTVPTGAHVSSLSSAPMRPAMKPRRPELNRPATADPYASRKTTGTDSSSSKPKTSTTIVSGSPRTTTRAKTPSKPSSASRPRAAKADAMHLSSTKAKPKKLDISSFRSQDVHAVGSRSRTHSNASDDDLAHANLLDSDDTPGSPASIALESPTRSVTQRRIAAPQVEPIPAVDLLAATTQPLDYPVIESSPMIDSPHPVSDNDLSSFTPAFAVVAEPEVAPKPDPVQIYEDPAVPASPEVENDLISTGPDQSISSPELSAVVAVVPDEQKSENWVNADTLAHDQPVTSADESLLVPSSTSSSSPPSRKSGANVTQTLPSVQTPANSSNSIGNNPIPLSSNVSPFDPFKSLYDPALSLTNTPATTNNNENKMPPMGKTPLAHRSLDSKSNALEEIPTNEPAYRDNKLPHPFEFKPQVDIENPTAGTEQSHRRWRKIEISERRRSISPRSKDPEQARQMLTKGVHRIRSQNMDILGYRKMQGLVQYHDKMFKDEGRYDDLLLALLDELESVPDEKRKPLGRPLDLKTQVLVTIRLMFKYNNMYFAAYYPKAMVALVNARKGYESSCHVVSGLDETAEDIVARCKPMDVITAVLDLCETEERSTEGYRAITMGILVLKKIICRLNNANTRLPPEGIDRIGKFAAMFLANDQPEVRRQMIYMCVEFHTMLKGDEPLYWKVIGQPRDTTRNLLTYYLNKP